MTSEYFSFKRLHGLATSIKSGSPPRLSDQSQARLLPRLRDFPAEAQDASPKYMV